MSSFQPAASTTGGSATIDTATATSPANTPTSAAVAAQAVTGEVLIASHGGPSGAAAIRLGRAIATRWGAPAEILGVVTPVLLYPPEIPVDIAMIEQVDEESLQAQLETQRTAATTGGITPISILTGGAAEEIVERAGERRTALIVVGLGRRDIVDRLLGGQTPIRILRRAVVPVLAVAPDSADLPRTVVLATDFSDSAAAAARLTLSFLPEGAVVYVVHVRPDMDGLTRAGGENYVWRRVIDEGTAVLTEQFREALPAPWRSRVQVKSLCGDAARVIRSFAHDVRADLVAVGSHGRGLRGRLLLGSVAEALLRSADCSVLIVPARATARL